MCNKTWDTRVAAAQAVEAIAKNVKRWEPQFQPKAEEPLPVANEFLSFDTFDITQVSN